MTQTEMLASVRLAVREEIEPLKLASAKLADEVIRQGERTNRIEEALNGPSGVVARLGIVSEIQARCPARLQQEAEQTTRTRALSEMEARLLSGRSLPPSRRTRERTQLRVARWKAITGIIVAAITAIGGAAGLYYAGKATTARADTMQTSEK